MPTFEIVCLANSRKYNHHCIAGVRTDGGGWVRPVGTAIEGSLSTPEITLPDGTLPRLLDVIEVRCSAPCPKPYQPENWTLDQKRWALGHGKWKLVMRPLENAARHLEPYVVSGPELFGNRHDRIDPQLFQTFPAKNSLVLVHPENMTWEVRLTSKLYRQTRVRFRLGSVFYNLSVTDPLAALGLADRPPGLYSPAEAGYGAGDEILFTVSLGEPFGREGYCYKLVAGVIVLPGCTKLQFSKEKNV